jgi:uncharacterized protein (TIGR00255 family)
MPGVGIGSIFMQSMTGYGHEIAALPHVGKVSIELRSTNHKFLEIVFHLPPGFLAVEDRIKKEMEAKFKRGRITCVVNISGAQNTEVSINKKVLKQYLSLSQNLRAEFGIEGKLSMDAALSMPGVLVQSENQSVRPDIWPKLKPVVCDAIQSLLATRIKEGKALNGFLVKRAALLDRELSSVHDRFKKASLERIQQLKNDDERTAFLKSTDITEELERLAYHIKNFRSTLAKTGTIGKELDFIAQEMQREVNTLAAKTFDTFISGRVIHMKSQIEKIREQVPNVE